MYNKTNFVELQQFFENSKCQRKHSPPPTLPQQAVKEDRTWGAEAQNRQTIEQNDERNEKQNESDVERLSGKTDPVIEENVAQKDEQENENKFDITSIPKHTIDSLIVNNEGRHEVLIEDTILLREQRINNTEHTAIQESHTNPQTENEPIMVNVSEELHVHHKVEDISNDNEIKVIDADDEEKVYGENKANKQNKPSLPPKPLNLMSLVKQVKTKNNDGQITSVTRKSKRMFRQKKRFDTRSSTTDSVISSTTVLSEESLENITDNRLHYMVTEVYRPWIKHQINVVNISSQLPLEKDDIAVIESKHKSCPQDAVDYMLDIMADSDIPGIWQSFIDALENQEYIHLSRLLRNETEVHHSHSTDILKLVTNDLVKRISFQDFMVKVFEKKLITSEEREQADAAFKAEGSIAGARVIIKFVDKHQPNWDELLADILHQSCMSDIAQLFEMIEQNQSHVLQKHDDQKAEQSSKQNLLRERRLQKWETKEQHPLVITDKNETVKEIKVKDFNALCIAVSEIQADVKKLLHDVGELKAN